MENLDRYIEYIKKQIKEDMTEEEIIMLVYIDLGKQFFFDVEAKLGNKKKREEIIKNANTQYKLDEIFKSKKIVCKTSSKILEYILKKIGINIITEETPYYVEFKHAYNIIYPKDREPYIIDLQDDLENIHFHTTTKCFGISLEDSTKYVVSRQRQKEIHEKIGYISKENPYTEEYLYLLKQDINEMDTLFEKIDFVLKNIEPTDSIQAKFWERGWKHKQMLDCLFPNGELKNKLYRVECYKTNPKQYINCYYLKIKENIYVYLYNEETKEYIRYEVKEFAHKMIEEEIEISREQKIPKLNNILKQIKQHTK